VITGDIFDKQKMTKAMEGVDAVLVSWRMRTQKIPLFSEGTQNAVDGMKTHGVNRLIVMSEYAYGEHFRNWGFFYKTLIKLYGAFVKSQQNERKLQDELIYTSGLDWTISRIRGMTEDAKPIEMEITFEPKNKVAVIPYALGAEKVLYQFEHPEKFIQKNTYF